MRYILSLQRKITGSSKYNALTKAPADVVKTLESLGIRKNTIVLPKQYGKAIEAIVGFLQIVRFAFSLKKNDIVFLQSFGYYVRLLMFLSRIKGVKFVVIVHDLNYIRLKGAFRKEMELKMLNNMDYALVHTEAMREVLMNEGITCPMRVMNLFDYYSEDSMHSLDVQLLQKNSVAFAGNLIKSKFLIPLNKTSIPEWLEYRLYGIENPFPRDLNPNIKYCGSFAPSKAGLIKAGWGLSWDGDSINTCSGLLGEYLRYNSSHKLSLYLACGMPVIVWKESALAQWLEEKGVCLLIDNLYEIPQKISEIDDSQYQQMVLNARKLGNILRNGGMLKAVLNDIS